MQNLDIENLTANLRDKSSTKRRSAARRLRKRADSVACNALLESLRVEVLDPRTWETQYQMIMALGECNCTVAISFLRDIMRQESHSKMLEIAIADSLVRIDRKFELDPTPVFRIFDIARIENRSGLADGAMRAVAMMRLKYSKEIVSEILYAVRQLGFCSTMYWTAAACAGWAGDEVQEFLTFCQNAEGFPPSLALEIREIASRSIRGEYSNLSHL